MTGPIATAHVQILADTSKFEADLEKKLQQSGASSGQAFGREFQKFQKDWAKFQDADKSLEKQAADSGDKAGKSWWQKFTSAIKGSGNNNSDLSKVLKGFTGDLGGIGKVSGIVGGISAALGGVLGVITMAAADLSKLLGGLALVPNVAGGAAAAFVTLKLAFSGFGAAVKAGFSGDMTKFQQALAGLAPAAQAAARAVVGLKDPLDALKNTAQEAFFGPLVDQINQFGKTLSSGPVADGVRELSKDLGEAAAAIAKVANSSFGQSGFQSLAQGLGDLVKAASPGLTAFFTSLMDVVGYLTPLMQQLGQWIGNVAAQFGAWLDESAASGRLTAWAQQAGQAFQQIGAIIGNLVQGFAALFLGIGKLQGQGGSFLDTLQQWSAGFAQWARTANGQQFAQSMIDFGTATLRVLKILTEAFLSFIMVVDTVGRTISGVVNAVGGFFGAIGQAAGAVGGFVANMGNAIASGQAFSGIVGLIVGALSGAGGALLKFAATAGIAVQQAVDWFNGIAAKIQAAFAGAGNWLVGAGKAIIDGFLSGLKSAWGAVTGFISGIGPWIAAHKGPISVDRQLLVPAGLAIMAGLDAGIRAGFSDVARTITGITMSVPGLAAPVLNTQPMQMMPSAFGGFPGGNHQSTTTTNTTTTTVHAPINVHAHSADPAMVARRAADRLARLATA